MKIAYKLVALISSCAVSAIAFAQELHTFSNGEIADADKINENFQYVLQNGGGGCSIAQNGSSVVITCADGSSGVLASAGTVVVYPEGLLGEVPDISSLATGKVVAVDANDVLLAQVQEITGDIISVRISSNLITDNNPEGHLYTSLVNVDDDKSVYFGPTNAVFKIYYEEENCTGQIFLSSGYNLVLDSAVNTFYTAAGNRLNGQILTNSYKVTASLTRGTGDCINEQSLAAQYFLWIGTEFIPPPEVINAAYPVRVKQLP